MALDFRDQYFGCEIEMTGLTRQQAARTLAELFGTSITHYGGTYDGYRVTDREEHEVQRQFIPIKLPVY